MYSTRSTNTKKTVWGTFIGGKDVVQHRLYGGREGSMEGREVGEAGTLTAILIHNNAIKRIGHSTVKIIAERI